MTLKCGGLIRSAVTGAVLTAASFATAQNCVSGPSKSHTILAGASNTVSIHALKTPEKAWNHLYRAIAATRTGKDEVFVREVAKALEVAPTFAEAYIVRASWELTLRQHEAAIEDVLTARRLQPEILWGGVLLAGAYNGLRRYAEAEAAISATTYVEHDTWQAKYEMARAVIGRRDAAEALRWSTAAFQAAPANCLDARLLVADAYLLAHRWTEAVTEFTGYIDSQLPQQHRAEVLAIIEQVQRRIKLEGGTAVASAAPERP